MTLLVHGTSTAARGGCRCAPCRAYKAARSRAYRARWPERVRAWRVAHAESERARSRFSLYGVTAGDYDEMLAAQGGVCAICHQPETKLRLGRLMSLSVDHDHRTGDNRGLLCHACNMALGRTEYVAENAIATALYLGAHL